MILVYAAVLVGAVGLIDLAAPHWNALSHRRWEFWRVRGLASFIAVVGAVCYGVAQLWTLPARAWRRLRLEGPTTLTVSATGLSWYNSKRRNAAGWERYDGYVVLPEALVFVARVPFIVPRSTVNALDFERVLTIAQRYLQPVKWYDSRTGGTSAASAVPGS
jgi:hypothetical protein